MLLEARVESPGYAQFALLIPPNLRCLRGLRSVKFHRLVLPGQTLNLTIKLDQDGDAIQFEYASAAGRHSSGRVLLHAVNA